MNQIKDAASPVQAGTTAATAIRNSNYLSGSLNNFPSVDAEYCAKCGKVVDFDELFIYEGLAYHKKCLPEDVREFVEGDSGGV